MCGGNMMLRTRLPAWQPSRCFGGRQLPVLSNGMQSFPSQITRFAVFLVNLVNLVTACRNLLLVKGGGGGHRDHSAIA